MKKLILTLIATLVLSASANAMSYEQARIQALFLTDKMAYELNLTEEQYEAAYEINLDYLMSVTSTELTGRIVIWISTTSSAIGNTELTWKLITSIAH